ncbi:MAG TPA: MOSC domain-containing protein [Gaiellaceae bacterium]|nr:MOSC domain-containing protein [Gaiellaceae bacterium]
MKVEAIHTRAAEESDVRAVDEIEALAGKGLVGDRYFYEDGAKPGLALTLVEADVVAEVGLRPGETRRQLTVTGTGLNDLVGKRFRVGEVECYGVELCEPCLHLQELTRPGIIKDLVHRAGLNADILVDGTISVGDEIAEL